MSHGMGHNVMGMPEMADRRMKHHMSAHPTFAQASKRRGESNLNKAALMPLSKPLNHLATSSTNDLAATLHAAYNQQRKKSVVTPSTVASSTGDEQSHTRNATPESSRSVATALMKQKVDLENQFDIQLAVKGKQVQQLTMQVENLEVANQSLEKQMNKLRLTNGRRFSDSRKNMNMPPMHSGSATAYAALERGNSNSGRSSAPSSPGGNASKRSGAARPRMSPMFAKFNKTPNNTGAAVLGFGMVSTEQHEKVLADKVSELAKKHEQDKEDLVEKVKILEFQLKAQEANDHFGARKQAEEVWHGAFGIPACQTDEMSAEQELKQLKKAHEDLAIQFFSTKQALEAQEHIEYHLRQELAIANGNYQVNLDDSDVTPIFTPMHTTEPTLDIVDERIKKQERRVQSTLQDVQNATARFRHIEDELTQENWKLRQHNEILMGKLVRMEQKCDALKNAHKQNNVQNVPITCHQVAQVPVAAVVESALANEQKTHQVKSQKIVGQQSNYTAQAADIVDSEEASKNCPKAQAINELSSRVEDAIKRLDEQKQQYDALSTFHSYVKEENDRHKQTIKQYEQRQAELLLELAEKSCETGTPSFAQKQMVQLALDSPQPSPVAGRSRNGSIFDHLSDSSYPAEVFTNFLAIFDPEDDEVASDAGADSVKRLEQCHSAETKALLTNCHENESHHS